VIATHYHKAARRLARSKGIRNIHFSNDRYYVHKEGPSPGGYALSSAVQAGLHPDLLPPGQYQGVEPRKETELRTAREGYFERESF
jgi:hypothetical protein